MRLHHSILPLLLLPLGAPFAAAQCPLQDFTAADAAASDNFSGDMALDGDRVLIGAANHDDLGADAGAAYLFERDANGDWQELVELLASDGGAGDYFGGSVALLGDLAVVGAYTDSPIAAFSGSAYVFERDPAGVWSETAKLVPNDGGPSQLFGSSVAIGGPDEILVGAPQALSGGISTGAVYLFRRTPSGWSQTGRLLENTPLLGAWFGARLDVSGNRVAIRSSPIGAPELGRTIVFDRSGLSWTQTQVIQEPGGVFVDLEGTRMLVTSPYDSTIWQWSGRVRIYDLIGGNWTATALIEPPDPDSLGFFGGSFALANGRVVVSSRTMIYQFDEGPGGWQESSRISGPVGHFGFGPISLAGERMLVGATQDGPGRVTEYLMGPTEEVYCESQPSSTGAVARIFASECNAASAGDLGLQATPVPNGPGLFYFGSQAIQAPFGAGVRCVGGATFRFPVQMAQGGAFTLDVDLNASPATQITAGSTWYFQCWFRDASDPAGFNLSDGVSVRFL